jgi:transcriptional regulator with XRE-family HTH domain
MQYERKNPISAEHQAILIAIGEKVQILRTATGLSIERYCVKNDLARISYSNLQSGKNFHMTTLLKVLDAHPEIKSLGDFFKGI